MPPAVIIVDHGSMREDSNRLLADVASAFASRFAERCEIIEPAHMELAEPTIAQAFAACVRRGAMRIVILPYFLGPGRHWTDDIPRLAAEAAAGYPGIQWALAAPLGLDDLLLELLEKRLRQAEESRHG